MVSKGFPQLLDELRLSKDTSEIVKTQKVTINRYEETNEMLRQFNELSEQRYKDLLQNYTDHTKTLLALKKDLDSCHKRIRNVKTKLREQYPESFAATADAIQELQERYDLEDRLKFDPTKEHTDENETKVQQQSNIITNMTSGTTEQNTSPSDNDKLESNEHTLTNNMHTNDRNAQENIKEENNIELVSTDHCNVLEKMTSDDSALSIISSPRSVDNTSAVTDSPSDLIVNISLTSTPEHIAQPSDV